MKSSMLLLAGVALLLAPARLEGQLSADSTRMIDAVFEQFNRSDTPGCVVGVDRNGTALYRRGYGMASLEFGVPLTEHSVLESGSLAKQFTAGAIIHLALQGKLGLDDPIRKYLPELHDFGTPITLRMLLNHTSGLRDYWTLLELSGRRIGEHLFTMDEAFAIVIRQRELNLPPGSAYLYSNTNFLLLAKVVERVSGMSHARYSQERIFRPLGMAHTQWRDDWNRVVPGRATAYQRVGPDSFRVNMPYMHVYGSGSLLTTVTDLLRWNEHLTHPTVLGQPWADLMQQRGRLNDGTEIGYAAGIGVGQYRGEPLLQHTGGSAGYRTYLARWPERGLSIALLCNTGNALVPNPALLGRRVADIFIGLDGTPAPPAAAASAPDTPGSGPAPAAELAGLVGVYYSPELDVTYRVTEAGGRLSIHLAGPGDSLVLRRLKQDEYVAAEDGSRVTFIRSGTRAAGELRYTVNQARKIRFVRSRGGDRPLERR